MKLLTGKCKSEFLDYCFKNKETLFKRLMPEIQDLLDELEDISEIQLNALIIEFFDSVCIYIGSELSFRKSVKYRTVIYEDCFDKILGNCLDFKFKFYGKTRQQATEEAIKKANEIFNNR